MACRLQSSAFPAAILQPARRELIARAAASSRSGSIVRTPEAADRWTWLVIAAHTQLRLTRPLAEDLRRPWERSVEPNRLTPARVRRGFRNLRPALACPARAPKPTRPGPGRPTGSKNKRPATRYDVGKTVRRPETIIERNRIRP